MSASSRSMPVHCASRATPSRTRCSSRSSLTKAGAGPGSPTASSGSDVMPGFEEWESFYVIVRAAAGALIGLQFVVMTLIAERPHLATPEAGAAFATPTVAHFGAALLLSALMRVPWHGLGVGARFRGPPRGA